MRMAYRPVFDDGPPIFRHNGTMPLVTANTRQNPARHNAQRIQQLVRVAPFAAGQAAAPQNGQQMGRGNPAQGRREQ